MGAAPSKSPAHVNGRFVNQFFGWNPEMIERALVRIKQTAPSMRVNARDFWQVFSDYEVLRGTEFIHLDGTAFNMFADYELLQLEKQRQAAAAAAAAAAALAAQEEEARAAEAEQAPAGTPSARRHPVVDTGAGADAALLGGGGGAGGGAGAGAGAGRSTPHASNSNAKGAHASSHAAAARSPPGSPIARAGTSAAAQAAGAATRGGGVARAGQHAKGSLSAAVVAHPSAVTVDAHRVLVALAVCSDVAVERQVVLFRALFMREATDEPGCLTAPEWIEAFDEVLEVLQILGVVVRRKGSALESALRDLCEEHDPAKLSTEIVAGACRANLPWQRVLATLKNTRRIALRNSKVHALDATAGNAVAAAKHGRLKTLNDTLLASEAMLKNLANLKPPATFDVSQLRDLGPKFAEASRGRGCLTRDEFYDLLKSEYPVLGNGPSIDALFDAFDADNNGTIDFQEFAVGLCKRMPGDLDEKLMLIIEALSGGAPRVAVATLRDLLSVEANEFVELAELTEEIVMGLDEDASGTITRDEFVDQLLAMPALAQCVKRSACTLGIGHIKREFADCPGRKPSLRDLTKVYEEARLETLAALRGDIEPEDRWAPRRLTLAHVGDILRKRLHLSEDVTLVLGEHVFDRLDSDRTGLVGREDIFHVWSQLCEGTDHELLNLMFSLFDENSNTWLEMEEIQKLVMHSQQEASVNAKVTQRVLRTYETRSKDRKIDMVGLKELFFKYPRVRACFSALFGLIIEVTTDDRAKEIGRLLIGPEATAGTPHSTPGAPIGASYSKRKKPLGREAVDGLRMLRKTSLRTAGTIVKSLQANLHAAHERPATSGYKRESAAAVRAAAQQYAGMLNRTVGDSVVSLKVQIKETETAEQQAGATAAAAERAALRSQAQTRRMASSAQLANSAAALAASDAAVAAFRQRRRQQHRKTTSTGSPTTSRASPSKRHGHSRGGGQQRGGAFTRIGKRVASRSSGLGRRGRDERAHASEVSAMNYAIGSNFAEKRAAARKAAGGGTGLLEHNGSAAAAAVANAAVPLSSVATAVRLPPGTSHERRVRRINNGVAVPQLALPQHHQLEDGDEGMMRTTFVPARVAGPASSLVSGDIWANMPMSPVTVPRDGGLTSSRSTVSPPRLLNTAASSASLHGFPALPSGGGGGGGGGGGAAMDHLLSPKHRRMKARSRRTKPLVSRRAAMARSQRMPSSSPSRTSRRPSSSSTSRPATATATDADPSSGDGGEVLSGTLRHTASVPALRRMRKRPGTSGSAAVSPLSLTPTGADSGKGGASPSPLGRRRRPGAPRMFEFGKGSSAAGQRHVMAAQQHAARVMQQRETAMGGGDKQEAGMASTAQGWSSAAASSHSLRVLESPPLVLGATVEPSPNGGLLMSSVEDIEFGDDTDGATLRQSARLLPTSPTGRSSRDAYGYASPPPGSPSLPSPHRSRLFGASPRDTTTFMRTPRSARSSSRGSDPLRASKEGSTFRPGNDESATPLVASGRFRH